MRKLALVACLALGLAAAPSVASAAPVGPVGCVAGLVCDISVDDVTGYTFLDAISQIGFSPDWLVGYTFLLSAAADLSDGIQGSDVAQALVIHASSLELFTPLSGLFAGIVGNALAGLAIDGTDLSVGQIVGTPIFDGVNQLNGIGYFPTAATVSMLVAWGSAGLGGYDTVNIHTIGQTQPPQSVPEPGSLSLLAMGGVGLFISALRRRRAAAKIA